jgi:hypothetical protein
MSHAHCPIPTTAMTNLQWNFFKEELRRQKEEVIYYFIIS